MRQRLLNLIEHPLAPVVTIILAILFRLTAAVALDGKPFRADAYWYQVVAERLIAGEEKDFYWQPGLPLYLTIFNRLLGPSPRATNFAMFVLSIAVLSMIYVLTRRLVSKTAAIIALLFLSIYPNYIYQSVIPLTQPFAALMLMLILYNIVEMKSKPTILRSGWNGLCAGWMTLIRPSSSLFLIFVPFLTWLKGKRIRLAALALIVALLPVAMWVTYASKRAGHFVFVNHSNSMNFFLGNNPYTPLYRTWWFGVHYKVSDGVPPAYVPIRDSLFALTWEERDKAFSKNAISHIVTRPDLFIIRTLSRIRCYFAFDTFTGAEIIKGLKTGVASGLAVMAVDCLIYMILTSLALLYLFIPGGRLDPSVVKLLWAMILIYAFPYFISYSHPSYHFPVMALLAVPAADVGERLLRSPSSFSIINGRKKWMILTFGILLFIQIEWVVVSFSRVWE